MDYLCQTIDDLSEIAAQIMGNHPGRSIFLLRGELGAGKTSLVKAFCAHLQVSDEVTSPTFSLVNEYRLPSGQPLYHIDLYRLKTVEEAFDIGLEEYLGSGSFCFIEWPTIAEPFYPEYSVLIEIAILPNSARKIRILNDVLQQTG